MDYLLRNRVWFGFVSAMGLWLAEPEMLGAADDANTLITRVLETNRPWLEPKPASGNYNLLRRSDGESDEITGPFLINEPATNSNWGAHWPLPQRVGSIVWTPLHIMAHQESTYTAVLVGLTNWNRHYSVAILDVTFAGDATCEIGMGGQRNAKGQTSYTSGGASVGTARLLIETNSAVPLYIETHPSPSDEVGNATFWRFDPLFFQVDGGLAPRSFDFEAPFFRERQEFQTAGSVWIFKRGDGWYGTDLFGGRTGHIQTIEVTDLQLEIPMTIRADGSNVVISLPSGETGYGVDATDNLGGPWLRMGSRASADGTTITLLKPAEKPAQFYRLRK